MMVKRGRPGIKPHIESLIVSRVLVDREKPRKEWTPRKALALELQREIEGMHEPAPELSTLEKRISDYSNKNKTPDPKDKPWSTATLDSYPIPPEALSTVLKVWKLCIEKGQGFTIREAKWAARFSALERDIDRLFFLASRHARTELMFELIGRPFDSTELDRSLMGLPVGLSDLKSFLWLLAEQEDGIEQVRDLKEGKRKKLTIYPFGQKAISKEAPHISPGLARELSDKEVQNER